MTIVNRLRELDFLRGVAIILVLFRHQSVFTYASTMGWIGVDLFFVISGFLVSGLLFREHIKFGNIQPKIFLIRRAFKIYPIYFLFYGLYLIPVLTKGNYSVFYILSDMTFIQNYVYGWGYAFGASWSLAVEEHFYFGFAIILWLALKYNKITLIKNDNIKKGITSFEIIIISILLFCLCLRIHSNLEFPLQYARNITMTHLRIDSLLAGVLISYLYYYRKNYLTKMYNYKKHLLFFIAILGLVWTPFIEPLPSFFAKTIGFTLLYISFGIILLYVLLTDDINQKLNKVFTNHIVTFISKIGYCSYSIYINHVFINGATNRLNASLNLKLNPHLSLLISTVVIISLGMFMTYKIESYFLKIRDKHFPNRNKII